MFLKKPGELFLKGSKLKESFSWSVQAVLCWWSLQMLTFKLDRVVKTLFSCMFEHMSINYCAYVPLFYQKFNMNT